MNKTEVVMYRVTYSYPMPSLKTHNRVTSYEHSDLQSLRDYIEFEKGVAKYNGGELRDIIIERITTIRETIPE